MSAEDLDKLFRDKLKNQPGAPSPEAWERLQARMQETGTEATPNPFLVRAQAEEKEERKPVMMWYYSAAAAVTMLLSVGLWVNRNHLDLGQASGPVTTVQTTDKPTTTPKANGQELVKVPGTIAAENSQPTPTPAPEVTQPQKMASATPETAGSKADQTNQQPLKKQKETILAQPAKVHQAPEAAYLATTAPVKKAESATVATDSEPLEIIVKLDNSQATTSSALASTTIADSPDEDDQRSAGRVVKNIFKQVKNLRDGEKIDREALGIPKHTFAFETRIGNKTISKSIQL